MTVDAVMPFQAASAGGTPASLASLDSLLEALLRVAGLHARMQALQWALSLRSNVLSQVSHHYVRHEDPSAHVRTCHKTCAGFKLLVTSIPGATAC